MHTSSELKFVLFRDGVARIEKAKDMTQRQAEREQSSRSEEDPAAGSRVRAIPVTREEFCSGFDRCFGRVYAYVSQRVDDRESCERIVRQVLTASLDLLVERSDERRKLSWLKASSDRLIGLETRASTGAVVES